MMKQAKPVQPQPVTLESRILGAFRDGQVTRADLMARDAIRIMTWAKVDECLKDLIKRRVIVATKSGWKMA